MGNELSDRQTAIRLRLAGESIENICRTLKRSKPWFHKLWKHYLALGPEGLYDLTRATQRVVNRTPPHIERAVVSIRRRLAARATPQTRYSLVGASQIRAELEALGYSPLPSLRTIERIVARAGLTCPPLRLSPRLARSKYPAPRAQDSNQVHQVDVVGPRYLKGKSTRYYFLVCKDIFDQSIYIEFVNSRKMDVVLEFLVHSWQHLGLPKKVQFDNGREFCGFGHAARYLSRGIRLCLRLGVEPVFIPARMPQRSRLMKAVNEEHIHPRLGHKAAAQYRRGKQLRKLPADFSLDGRKLPPAVGKVTLVRFVTTEGYINILCQRFKIGKRLKFQYVIATIYTLGRP